MFAPLPSCPKFPEPEALIVVFEKNTAKEAPSLEPEAIKLTGKLKLPETSPGVFFAFFVPSPYCPFEF
jgi:hypothetical protein